MAALSHPIPDHHEGFLKRFLDLKEEDAIPDQAVELYDKIRRYLSIMGIRGLHAEHMVLIPLMMGTEPKYKARSFLDIMAEKKAKSGDKVVAQFRGEWRVGTLMGSTGKQIQVEFDDDTAEIRRIQPTKVRLPDKEELQLTEV